MNKNFRRYALNPGWEIVPQEGERIVFRSDRKIYSINCTQRQSLEAILEVSNGMTMDVERESPTGILFEKLKKLLVVRQISSEMTDSELASPTTGQEKYWQHIGIALEDAKARLTTAHVLILGLGGTGSIVVQHLVAAGVRNFILLDRDLVEASNLERQFIYGPHDVGSYKTQAAAGYIRARCASADVRLIEANINSDEQLKEIISTIPSCDFAAVCIDEPMNEAFDRASNALWSSSIPFIHGGVMATTGFYGPLFSPGDGLICPNQFRLRPESHRTNLATPLRLAHGAYNSLVGAAMASDILHYLVGSVCEIDMAHRTHFSFRDWKITKIPPNPTSH